MDGNNTLRTSSTGTGGTRIGAAIRFDYNNTSTSEKNNYSIRPPSFNGDAAKFSWWKSKMYSHIIEVDDNRWDIIVDGVSFPIDSEGMVVDIKSLTEVQRNIYIKRQWLCGILVEDWPHSKYTKIVDKSTANAIFESLCSTYEGN